MMRRWYKWCISPQLTQMRRWPWRVLRLVCDTTLDCIDGVLDGDRAGRVVFLNLESDNPLVLLICGYTTILHCIVQWLRLGFNCLVKS
jgi:hypothetical protein